MDFTLPEHLPGVLAEMDAFIEAEIKPLERENIQYFDRRREFARTDLDNGGVPRREWEDLLDEADLALAYTSLGNYSDDELDALGPIDGLKDALARLRKFGGRCVLGFQSIAQVSSTYGHGEAQTIVENCSNTLIISSHSELGEKAR